MAWSSRKMEFDNAYGVCLLLWVLSSTHYLEELVIRDPSQMQYLHLSPSHLYLIYGVCFMTAKLSKVLSYWIILKSPHSAC